MTDSEIKKILTSMDIMLRQHKKSIADLRRDLGNAEKSISKLNQDLKKLNSEITTIKQKAVMKK